MEKLIKVLIIDDDAEIRTVIKDNLKRTGNFKVMTASGGAIGRHLASQHWHKPDIVLLDIMMPNMDGFEVLRLLRNHRQTTYIPVIIITARTDVESKIKAEGLYCDDYIVKPCDLNELKLRIKNLLAKRGIKVEDYLNKENESGGG